MPYSNPITQNELQDLALYNPLHPRDGSPAEQYMPQAYFLVPPATQAGPVKWRLFDAAYITTGIIDPNRLGTGATGAGNLYLADDGTWKAVSGGGVTTLDGLSDVTISAPANAQVLAYNSTTSQWENQTPTGGGGGGDMNKSTYDVDNDGVVDSAERTEIIVRNSTGSTLTKGTVVYLSGATGNRPNALRAQAHTEATSSKTIGIVVANINNNSDGYVATNGTLHNLDTSAFADGVAVWLSATTAGGITSTVPAEPNHAVFIGWIARSHPTQGRIVLHIQNGYELNELHGVLVTSEANNDLLVYESSTALWKNKTISAIFGGTPLITVPTLAQVTTAGNTTTNAINTGLITTTTSAVGNMFSVNGANNTSLTVTNDSFGRATITIKGNPSATGQAGAYFGAEGYQEAWFNVIARAASAGNQYWRFGNIGTGVSNNVFAIQKLNDTGTAIALTALTIFSDNGNVGINTTTDAGYKLDVNGAVRVTGNITSTNIIFAERLYGSLFSAVTVGPVTGYWSEVGGTDYTWKFAPGLASAVSTLGVGYNRTQPGYTGTGYTALVATYNKVGISFSTGNDFVIVSQPYAGHYTDSDLDLDDVTSYLKIFSATQNVAIGTTIDSGYKLDVTGTFRATGNAIVNYMTASNGVSINQGADLRSTDSVVGWRIRDPFGGAYLYNNSGPFLFHTTQFEIRDNSTTIKHFIANSTGVTIGSSAPATKLYIEGGSADWNETTPGLGLGTIHLDPNTSANNYGGAITFGATDDPANGGNSHAGIYVRSNDTYGTKMYFATTDAYLAGSKTRMMIDHLGNVGIGTTNPLERLHVSGANRMLIGDVVSPAADAHTRLIIHTTTNQANIVLDPRPTALDNFYRIKIGVNVDSNGSFFIEQDGGKQFEFFGGGGSTKLTSIVALGHKSPSFPAVEAYGLHMHSPFNWSSLLRFTHDSYGITSTDGAMVGILRSDGFVTWMYEDAPMMFATNNVERLRITNTGNVGIGTNSPQNYGTGYRVLHIGNATGASGLIKLTTGTSLDGPEIYTDASNNLFLNTNGASNRITISGSTGNVGIGTTTPSASYKLDVNGDAKARFWDAHDASAVTGFRLFSAGGFRGGLGLGGWSGTSGAATNDIVQVISGVNYHIGSGGATKVTVLSNGKMGIGTNNPATLLNVNVGGSDANGTAGITVGGTGNYLSLEFGIEGGYDGMIRTYGNDLLLYSGHWRTVGTNSTENHSIKFFTSQAGSSNWSTPKMILNHLGNLGIGTTSPSYKLHVEGTTYINSYVTVTDGTTGVDMYADSIYGRGAMGLGSTIQPSGSNRHLRILTPTDGGAGEISIGYFKTGVGLAWNRALNISTAPAVPHLMLQPDSGNVVIGTTTNPGHKLHVEGDINTSGIFRVGGVAGWTGTIFIATNPPGQQNITVVGGIITGLG